MADKDTNTEESLEAAAAAEAKAEEASRKRTADNELRGINIIGKIIGILVMIWLISLSYYAFVFFVLGMFPSLLAMVIDRGSGRFASKTVTACNFVGIMAYLFEIAMSYEHDIAAKDLMSDPWTWPFIYGFAAVGLILIWIVPQLTVIFFSMRADLKMAALNKEQGALLDEWGEEVKTGKQKR